ncbi:MAG: hypothetical protein P1P85_01850 [Patescibacteria group bacterium]|nr:hypothetical protein [Patescibacteria group bacterium]
MIDRDKKNNANDKEKEAVFSEDADIVISNEPKNEFQDEIKKVSSGNSVSNAAFLFGELDDLRKDKDEIREKILKEKETTIENISRNISAESIGVEMKVEDGKSLFPISKKEKKSGLIFVIGFLIILLIGVVLAYFFVFKKNNLPVVKSNYQEQIIMSSMETMKDVKTYNFTGEFKLKSSTKDEEGNVAYEISTELDMSGKVNETDISDPKVFYNLDITNSTIMDGTKEIVSFNIDMLEFGKGEQSQSYVKLNNYNLGTQGMWASIFGTILEPYKGNWYMGKPEDLKNITGENISTSNYDINQINNLYNKYQFIKFENDLGDSKLGDINVYHYEVKLDSEAVINFYLDVLQESIELYEQKNFEKKNDMSIEELKNKVEEFRDNSNEFKELINKLIDDARVEIWIGKEDDFVYRIKVDLNLDKDFFLKLSETIFSDMDIDNEEADNTNESLNGNWQSSQVPNMSDEKNVDMSYSINLDFSMFDFNKPIEITKPEDAEDLSKAINEMFKGFSLPAGGLEIDSDGDGLSDELEYIYGTDINKTDTDGDGYSDGDEIKNGYDPVVSGEDSIY